MTNGVRITRIKIQNFRGIAAIDTPVSPQGAVVRGPNGKGKTSVLTAIRSALDAADIGPEAIRIGADHAEILIDLDAASVKRTITTKGSQLSVTTEQGVQRAPQRWLTDLLGAATTLDPVDFYTKKPKDRRAALLACLPIPITRADVLAAIPEELTGANDEVSAYLARFRPEGRHGLDVCAEVADLFFRHRTQVNATAKGLEAEHTTERKKLLDYEALVPASAQDWTLAKADDEHVRATSAHQALQRRDLDAAAQRERNAATLEKIQNLRRQSTSARAMADDAGADPQETASLERIMISANQRVAEAEAALAEARALAGEYAVKLQGWRALEDRAAALRADSVALAERANELAATVEASAIAPATPEELAAARALIVTAAQHVEIARSAEAARGLQGIVRSRRAAADAATLMAGKLTGLIEKFREELPRKLLRDTAGIPGLTLDGDRILLDGVDLDSLCGREQLYFATDLARRANAKARFIIVDGLERLDPDTYLDFIRYATRDGYQLLGTRVDKGDVVLEAIEPEPAQTAEQGAA